MKIKWSGKRTLIAVLLLAGVGILYVQGEDQRREPGPSGTPTSASQCRVASNEDGVRVRSTPALDPANVVDEMAAGEESDATKEVQNGFRKLAEGRWVSVDFTKPVEGSSC